MTNKIRGFEIVSTFQNKNINLPTRATIASAGYDFESAVDIIIPSIWKLIFKHTAKSLKQWIHRDNEELIDEKILKPILVPTGIKSYMQQDEYLQLTNRSSNPLKHFLVLPNGVGIVDSDYYNNANNEGHIFFQLTNFGLLDKQIKKGDRIGQGIFLKFLKSDNDSATSTREGGFGSSGVDSFQKEA